MTTTETNQNPSKPDCYKCKHRGTLAGNAHSKCKHPLVEQNSNDFGMLVDMMSGKNLEARQKLEIAGHPTGIRRGWFMWPACFDPVWLVTCNGWEAKA